MPECDQPWTPGACSDYGQPTGRSRHRIDFFLYGSSSGNFRPRHEEPSMVMVFARADTQEKGFPMWDFAFPHRKSDFQCRISFSCTGRVISCAGFHISRSGKAISCAGFHISRSGKAISSTGSCFSDTGKTISCAGMVLWLASLVSFPRRLEGSSGSLHDSCRSRGPTTVQAVGALL